MSRKDYERIAGAIREVRDDHKCEPDETFGIDIAETIARELGDENPRFDGLRFLRACGFSDDLIGRQRCPASPSREAGARSSELHHQTEGGAMIHTDGSTTVAERGSIIDRCDVTVSRTGDLFLVTPITAQAKDWIIDNVDDEALWFGGSLVVEHRYIVDLVDGLFDAGLRVE